MSQFRTVYDAKGIPRQSDQTFVDTSRMFNALGLYKADIPYDLKSALFTTIVNYKINHPDEDVGASDQVHTGPSGGRFRIDTKGRKIYLKR